MSTHATLSGVAPSAAEVHTAMTADEDLQASDPAYGSKTSSTRRIARARQLAINQFASPKVGEGFATFSTRPRRGRKTWGYHYAGVVARSADGHDWVTLENYNRSGDIKRLAETVYRRVLKQNRQVVLDKIDQLKQAQSTMSADAWGSDMRYFELEDLQAKLTSENVFRKLREVLVAIRENAGSDRANAENDFQRLLDTDANRKWFFHLYGSAKGQSFHEQAVKSGYFMNPLTLRVSKT